MILSARGNVEYLLSFLLISLSFSRIFLVCEHHALYMYTAYGYTSGHRSNLDKRQRSTCIFPKREKSPARRESCINACKSEKDFDPDPNACLCETHCAKDCFTTQPTNSNKSSFASKQSTRVDKLSTKTATSVSDPQRLENERKIHAQLLLKFLLPLSELDNSVSYDDTEYDVIAGEIYDYPYIKSNELDLVDFNAIYFITEAIVRSEMRL